MIFRLLQENCTLLAEINNLRTELKSTRTRCFQMESILGLSARYVPPTTARAKLKHVTEDRELLDEKYKQKIEVNIFLRGVIINNIIWRRVHFEYITEKNNVVSSSYYTSGSSFDFRAIRPFFCQNWYSNTKQFNRVILKIQ